MGYTFGGGGGRSHRGSSACRHISTMGLKCGCDKIYEDLERVRSYEQLGGLRWYAAGRFSRDWEAGTLTISPQAFADGLAAKLGVIRGKSTPDVVDPKLNEFDKDGPAVDEPDDDEPFRSLVGHFVRLANQTQPYILNAVRAMARCSAAS